VTEDLSTPFQGLWLLYPLGAFLLGAIPFGKIIGRFIAGMDITRHGSGNIGASNVARTLGVKWGLLTLCLDALKGFVPVFLLARLLPEASLGPSVVGLSALLGHQFSPFLGFRGGKGVSTAFGAYLAIAPGLCLVSLAFFIITVYIWDFISLGSMVSACTIPLLLLASGRPGGVVAAAVIMATLVCIKHRDNIQRMANGRESKWRKKGPMSESPEDDPAHHRNRSK